MGRHGTRGRGRAPARAYARTTWRYRRRAVAAVRRPPLHRTGIAHHLRCHLLRVDDGDPAFHPHRRPRAAIIRRDSAGGLGRGRSLFLLATERRAGFQRLRVQAIELARARDHFVVQIPDEQSPARVRFVNVAVVPERRPVATKNWLSLVIFIDERTGIRKRDFSGRGGVREIDDAHTGLVIPADQHVPRVRRYDVVVVPRTIL